MRKRTVITRDDIRERYEAISKTNGMATTPSGKRVFVFRVDRYTGMARVMYHPSEKKSDISIMKLAARDFL